MSNARDRSFYERQGAQALEGHADFHCSQSSIVDAIVRMVRPHIDEFESILDVGCGANLHYDMAIAGAGKRVFGVDFTMSFLRLAPQQRPGIFLAQADALRLPFKDGSFSAVICSETIEHIPHDSAVIAEIARVLRPQALLFVTVPNLWNADRLIRMAKTRDFTVRLMEGHVREYSPRKLRRLLSNWFTIERRVPIGFGWSGRFGGSLERMVHLPGLRRFCSSIAFVARRR